MHGCSYIPTIETWWVNIMVWSWNQNHSVKSKNHFPHFFKYVLKLTIIFIVIHPERTSYNSLVYSLIWDNGPRRCAKVGTHSPGDL